MGRRQDRAKASQLYRTQYYPCAATTAALLAVQLCCEAAPVFSYHLTPANLAPYVGALVRFQPEIIDGYPSAIHIVADHILRNRQVGLFRPRAILVSAETVLPHQRAVIESAFGAKLYNQYSSSEGAPFISECSKGKLHVHPDSGLIETLDADGNPTAPGQVGQLVVTSFTTHVVPLLRFAIGDTAVASKEDRCCQCGLSFPTVEAIGGRTDDVLWTADRGFIGRLDTVFKGLPNSIVETQIVQTTLESIVVRLVPDRTKYKHEHAEKLVKEMRRKVGDVVAIDIEEVGCIPRAANGKLRAVVNQCGSLLPSRFEQDSGVGGSGLNN